MINFQHENHLARAIAIIDLLKDATRGMIPPASDSIIEEFGREPFLVLISCILSLRTKDTVSLPASRRLFLLAKTPELMLNVPLSVIQEAVYPVGFYRNKAITIHKICMMLIEKHESRVPDTQEGLLALPGVGRKTMNLVLSQGFEKPGLCVDTHVHRISNRLGLVSTNTPEETEIALKQLLPPALWNDYARCMVMCGQNRCLPVLPWCSRCPLQSVCPRIMVKKTR